MKRYDVLFIAAALACLLMGESLGIWMGVNEDFTLSPAHAHLNLVGWATLAAYGLIHRAYPVLATSRLAAAQCVLAVIGALVLPFGIGYAILMHNPIFAIVGSFAVLIATLLFATLFLQRAARAPAAA